MAIIHFTFEDKSLQPVTVDDALEGMSILDVAEENDIHLNHNCGAVCACSTCHVYVTKGMDTLPEVSDREEDFIDRAIDPTIDSRLGCQCVLQGDTTELEVTIPDQKQIIGHEH